MGTDSSNNCRRFRGGLVFKARKFLYHSSLSRESYIREDDAGADLFRPSFRKLSTDDGALSSVFECLGLLPALCLESRLELCLGELPGEALPLFPLPPPCAQRLRIGVWGA